MLFLGTAAAEQFPNPFCGCETCQRTRSSGDSRDFRRRSSFRLDEETLIDFNADTLFASSQYRSPLTGLQNLFVTHMHEDHFDYWNMEFLNMSVTPCKPLQVYLSPEAAEGFSEACRLLRKAPFDQMREQFFRMEKVYELHPLPFYETVKVGEMLATPMRASLTGSTAPILYLSALPAMSCTPATPGGFMGKRWNGCKTGIWTFWSSRGASG